MSIKKYLDKFPDLENKTIIVTGANAGVGFELCRHLLCKKAHVVMACRNAEKTNAAREILCKEFDNPNVDILLYDQASFESIDYAVKIIKDKYKDFYGLVCNAGLLGPMKGGEYTQEGFPVTIGTNYLGLYYLYNQLSDFLNKSEIERKVIFQGSMVSDMKTPKGMDILDDDYSQWVKYNLSKKCVECLFKYAYTQNSNDRVAYLLSEPGVTKTSFFRSMNFIFRTVGGVFVRLTSHSPKKASLTMLRCLMSDTKNGETYLPRGLGRIRGYPKKYPFKEKRYVDKLILRGQECLKLK